MSINLTLIIQTLVFLAVVWLTMKYIWPVILGAMEEREKKIADGLAASDKAENALESAQAQANEIIKEAKNDAAAIRDQASQMASKIKEQAKSDAVAEKERQLSATRVEIEQEANRAKEALRQEVSSLAIIGAEQLLAKEVDEAAHKDLLDQLVKEI